MEKGKVTLVCARAKGCGSFKEGDGGECVHQEEHPTVKDLYLGWCHEIGGRNGISIELMKGK